MVLRGFLTFIGFMILSLFFGCVNTQNLVKDESKIFGLWLFDKIVYSNYTLDVAYVSNTVFVFENRIANVSNNITNYYGSIEVYSQVITNLWNVDLRANKISLIVSNTNFIYTIALVAVDSEDVNYIWLMDGFFVYSGVTNNFFVSNGIKMYTLKKL